MLIYREQLPDLVWQMKALVAGTRPPRDVDETDFLAFHYDNPTIYILFDKYAREAIARGKHRYSAWRLVNGIRWDYFLQTKDDQREFKISNGYIALYARLWMENNPAYHDYITTKLRDVEISLVAKMGAQVETYTDSLKRRKHAD